MNSSRNSRIKRELRAIVAGVGSLITFCLIVHFVPPGVRGVLLGVWILAALPLFIAGLASQPVFSVAVTVTSFCFAMAYISDMGGPYSHDFAAAAIGFEATLFTLVLIIVFFVKLFKTPRPATRSRYGRASVEKWTGLDQADQEHGDRP